MLDLTESETRLLEKALSIAMDAIRESAAGLQVMGYATEAGRLMGDHAGMNGLRFKIASHLDA